MNKHFTASTAAAVLLSSLAATAFAQAMPIERVRLTDNELKCAQIHAGAAEMDREIAAAKALEAEGNSRATAGSAAGVAADVAGRTGLFGQIGGLTGHLFGQVAAKTAAGATQQSGQSSAQQAQERAREALARKDHLTTLFLNRGCKASDLAYDPPAGSAPMQVAAVAPSPAVVGAENEKSVLAAANATLPDLDPDAYFKGKTGGTFGRNVVEVLPASKRVAVLGFRVAFITRNTATAQVRASYLPGRDTSGASSSLTVNLKGVDHATLQTLTDKAYADFLAQLRASGREVVPQEEFREFLSSVEVSPSTPATPYAKEVGQQSGVVFAPTGMPLWFTNWDTGWGDKGPFEQKNIRGLAEASQKLRAIAIAPLVVVNFARMSSSGNRSGLTTTRAETGAELALGVGRLSSPVVRAEETRDGIVMKGDDASVALTAPIESTLKFGELREVGQSDNQAVKGAFDAIGRSMGLANAGGAVRSRSENVAQSSNGAFSLAAADAMGRATGTLARLFQKYPAR